MDKTQAKQAKTETVQKYALKKGDTGSPEVQVALLTDRIKTLSPHLEKNKHDYSSMRGLMKMIGQRKSLLKYLARVDEKRYQKLINSLGLRK